MYSHSKTLDLLEINFGIKDFASNPCSVIQNDSSRWLLGFIFVLCEKVEVKNDV